MPPRQLHCSDCGCRFPLDRWDEDARRVRCPECGASVPVRSGSGRGKPPSRTKWVLLALGLVAFLGLGCCGGIGYWGWATLFRPTSFPEQTQDYADARAGFKTVLVRSGPAPQTWEPETPPPGVNRVSYTSGNLQLTAWVNPPAGGPPRPAVLFLHGGFAFGEEDWDQCQPFRDAGFVTMTPWLRGENGQPGTYTLFFDEVNDVVAAAEALARTPGVDPNRVFVAGHSAGGTLAMLGAMTSKRFKGCASFSGSPDQVRFVEGQEGLAPFDVNNRMELQMRSPLAFPKSFKCPARLYWGDEELEFKFSTQRLAKKAQAAGLDVQAVEVPGEHMTAVAPAMRQAVAFFQQAK